MRNIHIGVNMRTNIVINDELMKKAQKATGLKTKKDTIEAGLKLLVKMNGQQKILKYKGKLNWSGNLEESRKSRI